MTPSGTKKLLVPDYSSPWTSLKQQYDTLKSCKKYEWIEERKNDYEPDVWWHEGTDAWHGHGFAYFQYDGPDLDAELNNECSTSPYDHKTYWGKTGSSPSIPWEYGNGSRNQESDLAWWDVCDYKFNKKYLVIKRTYTLPPTLASSLFTTISKPERYDNFGLHINDEAKAWSCLSNVSLAMDDHDIDTRINKCLFSKNMPTTGNRSVWNVMIGTELVHSDSGKAGIKLIDEVVRAVLKETKGLSWAAVVDITGPGTLQEKLFEILEGKEIYLPREGNVLIDKMSKLGLDNDAETYLAFYDPGLFPVEFGENPEDVFNMSLPNE